MIIWFRVPNILLFEKNSNLLFRIYINLLKKESLLEKLLVGEQLLVAKLGFIPTKDSAQLNLFRIGKIKVKESKESCLKREIKEEVNITVKIIDKIGTIKHQYSHFKVIITLFKCKYISGQACANESQDIQWIDWKEKKQFAFPNATHKLFQLLMD